MRVSVELLPPVAACVVMFASSVPARGDEAAGRKHWNRGRDLYEKGRYREAAREFEAGYATAPRPLFLLNLGHAYRRAQEMFKAKSAYQRLLRVYPEFPQREEVQGYIASIDDALAAAETEADAGTLKARPRGPPAARAPALTLVDPTLAPPRARAAIPPSPRSAPVVVQHSVAPAADTPADPPASRSVFRSPWFWVVTAVLVAGGVAAGVVFTQPKSACPERSVCFSEP